MDTFLLIGRNILWIVVLLNLILTLRIIRWIKATTEVKAPQQKPIENCELVIGAPAPEFRARDLAGQAIRLDNYVGRSIAFLFVSPACGHCRLEMPMFMKLAPLAKKNAGVEIILVSDWGPVMTQQWLDTMHNEDGVEVTLPVLVAPLGKSDFLDDYNPGHLTPSYCLLNTEGKIQAMGQVPSVEWNKLKRVWEGTNRISPLIFHQYR